ncbi:hypothetical protein [Halopiger xanaduensis]|uniref:DUF1102 domain-containing protein n=1 Tax=Halopiger xanaduensis (strain DSM 18323 / JCM 14033 / SH-6) TaxID=797210 RepID=F8DA91_HALXS|nr:hypothetical protein [Halopiger xanaduensis]AEH38164.1 hypothetical protein Halxa_3553 [Halopiger xanaduensis SH-6]
MATAAAVGTGAFDSVEADRTVQVSTAGDADAYLGITGDGEYVTDDSSDSELTIDLGGPTNSNDGEGFNENAVTEVSDVVTITNQGTENVTVSINETDVQSAVDFELSHSDELEPGDSVTLDVTVDDLNDDVDENASETLVIEANSN